MEYLVNEQGERTRVVLTVEEYERLIEAREELEDIADHEQAMADLESGKEERIPWEESKRLRRRERGQTSDAL